MGVKEYRRLKNNDPIIIDLIICNNFKLSHIYYVYFAFKNTNSLTK